MNIHETKGAVVARVRTHRIAFVIRKRVLVTARCRVDALRIVVSCCVEGCALVAHVILIDVFFDGQGCFASKHYERVGWANRIASIAVHAAIMDQMYEGRVAEYPHGCEVFSIGTKAYEVNYAAHVYMLRSCNAAIVSQRSRSVALLIWV